MTTQENKSNKSMEQKIEHIELETVTSQRKFTGLMGKVVLAFAVFVSLAHLYILNFVAVEPWIFRSFHVTLGCILGFALFPAWKKKDDSRIHWLDWLAILLSAGIFIYIYVNIDQLIFRAGVTPTNADFYMALIGTILILELTRRTSGWSLPILALIFIAYSFLGPYLPGILEHKGYRMERFFSYIYGLDGVFGVTVDVSSKYILLFIIFGSFLQASKVGDYFVNFSFSLAGGARGGPAKVAVISSGLMGMMSGTSAGNAVATGSLTIPLMRRVGYNPRFAAATEATASAGGQIMPPIMGAGAFMMAEIIGIPYSDIVIAALIPALLYFVSVYFMVDLEAIKKGLVGLKRSELPSLKGIFKQIYLFVPVIVLIGSMLSGLSIIRSGTYGIISCLIVSWFSKQTRMGLKATLEALADGARNVISLLAVCACAGIIVGVIALTGIGSKFSNLLLGVASTSQLLALIFAMLIAIILGMGMPTTAAYAVAASVVAPGLVRMGIEPLMAHMFVFYFAVISAITPPVALAAFAAAGVAGTNPMKTGVQAFRLGLAAFIVPYMFVYSPTLLAIGSGTAIAISIATSLVGIYFLSSAVQGYFLGFLNWLQRIILLIAALTLINAELFWDAVGLGLAVLVYLLGRFNKNSQAEAEKIGIS